VNALLPAGFYKDLIYEIHMEVDGVETQPAHAVTVRIPVPEGYVAAEISVYHIADDNSVTPVTFTVVDGMIVFTADSFSNFAVCATHEPAAAVEENRVEPTCTEPGSYDSVIYCALCGNELSREEDIGIPSTGHTPAEAVTENFNDSTCTEPGSYESVVYCAACGIELSRTPETVAVKAHTPGEPAKENEIAPDCTNAGSYVAVYTCTVCGTEISRETVTVPALGHDWGAWYSVTAPTTSEPGEERRNCLRCNEPETREIPCLSAPKDRRIQFVVSGDMNYVVHFDDVDYYIYSKTTPAVYWYSGRDLTFDVETRSGFKNGCIVAVNGTLIQPNANGSYTIPAGEAYTQINCYPAEAAAAESESDACVYCGKVHPNSIWGRIVAFFHTVFWFFTRLFKK
jgi:hypothetical protein